MLALFTFQNVSDDRAAGRQAAAIPAVVRLYDVVPAAHLAASPRGWSSTERLLEQDPEDFRKLSSEEIESCALALEGLSRRADHGALGSRSYLGTRLRALREHVDYARSELIKLPARRGDENFIPAHAHFYRTIKSLEQAFAQAATELNGDI